MNGHQPVEYELVPQPPQPSTRVRRDDETVVLSTCPRCLGPMAQLDGEAAPAKGIRFPRRHTAVPAWEPDVVECQCGLPHPGRPENAPAWGCGAFWNELATGG
ncbi:hypothetical protein [Actinoplanes sp. NPDC048796]|uniref:hypothetical protein n=1 Tax=unclassified Actinoplanes TaxID=2626549 RepID=UPI0033FB23D8